jgi:hypothetical protein
MEETVRALADLAAIDLQLTAGVAPGEEFTRAIARRRNALRKRIPGSLLESYDSLVRMGRRPAVVPASNAHCGGCHLRLPPQVDSSLRRRQSLCPCPHCRRLLYLPSGAGDGAKADEQDSRHRPKKDLEVTRVARVRRARPVESRSLTAKTPSVSARALDSRG